METLELLLNNRWILKSQNKELYYKMRDSIGEIRKFAVEKLGCQLIENAALVKLEKIPAIPEAFMGIGEFTSKEEYMFLCLVLMFLEDKDAEAQFILSQLTEYISSNSPEGTVDWTLYTNRRRLIKVLRYAVNQGMIRITDGSDDGFMDRQDGEVLYENTGASRYFMRNFSKDIMGYTKPEDFRESEWFEVDEDRGMARRQRVYKRLLFSVGMYRGVDSEEDFEYLKYYGHRMRDELEQNFDCRIHIHKGSAFFMAGESCQMGTVFPGNSILADIILLSCGEIRKKIEFGVWNMLPDERVVVSKIDFDNLLREIKKEYGAGFTKHYRELPEGDYIKDVVAEMERWTFIRVDESANTVTIYPSAGKLQGYYPEGFMN